MPVKQLRDTILSLFNNSDQYGDSILKTIFIDKMLDGSNFQVNFVAETNANPVFGTDYFKRNSNADDLFLYPMGSYWYSKSYFNGDKPFLFSTSFAFKFKAISEKKTLITVIDVNPEISNGEKCCSMHLGNVALIQPVKPTTVEEYTLILYVARKLEIKGMKQLVNPL